MGFQKNGGIEKIRQPLNIGFGFQIVPDSNSPATNESFSGCTTPECIRKCLPWLDLGSGIAVVDEFLFQAGKETFHRGVVITDLPIRSCI
jgi:hypothetical protein